MLTHETQVFLIYLAKKSGNFGSATQLSKQLVQETLLDEGMRVVKEFSNSSPPGTSKDNQAQLDLSVLASPRKTDDHVNAFQMNSEPESLMTPPTLRDAFPGMAMPPRPPPPPVHQPRPRGRPPKNPPTQMPTPVVDHHHFQAHHHPGFRDLRSSLEAAYHAEVAEKLQQHFQQTFFANQYSQQLMQAAAATNGFPGLERRLQQESLVVETNGVKRDGGGRENGDTECSGVAMEVDSVATVSSPNQSLSPNLNGKGVNRSLEELESCLNPGLEKRTNGNGGQAAHESLIE